MSTPDKKIASPLMVIVAFATVYIVWGSTYFFIQRAMSGFPPFVLGATRFLMAGIIMLLWTVFRGEKVFIIKDILHASVSGILMLFIGTGAVIWVEQYMPSAMVAIMISSGPLWFVLLDWPKWRGNFRNKATIGGVLLGFAGILLLFGKNIISAFTTAGSHRELGGMALLIMGSMAWASGSLYSKYKSVNGAASVSVNIAWQMLAAGVVFIIVALFRGELQQMDWHAIPVNAWLSIIYLVLMGSIAGFGAYVWLLQVRPATQVSTHAYVNPVVAVLLGVFFADEHITLLQVFGLMVILSSVLIINLVKQRQGRDATQQENITTGASRLREKIYPPVVVHSVKDIEA